jgi:hypothetical protein
MTNICTLFQLSNRSLRAVAASAAFMSASLAASGAVTWKNIQFGGSFSQGYLESTENNYPVDTEDGTFEFREMAVNASTTVGTHLRLGAQVFAQTFGKYGDDKPILDWALVDYNFRPEIGVRLGRLKFPRSLYSDVLDVDVVRPFIFLPQSIYDSRLRDFQASFDGGMIYGSLNVGQSSFDYKVFYGDIPMKTDSGVADFFNTSSLFANPPGVQNLGMDSVGGASLLWNTPVAGLRFGATYSVMSHLIASGPFIAMPALTSKIELEKMEYEGASVEYTNGPWTFAGEFLIGSGSTILTLPSFIAPPTTSKYGTKSYYGSVSRRLGAKFEVGTYYTETWNTRPSATIPLSDRSRRDWTFAVRYDVNDHLLFKLEVHAIDGTMDMFNVPGISNPPGTLKDSMTLFAAKTTLSF